MEEKLPDYLTNVENVYLVSSLEKESKRKGTYYREEYFVERNIDGVKEVLYVELESDEPNAIFKRHTIVNADVIGVKTEILRLLEEVETGKHAYEYLINDEFIFAPPFNIKRLSDIPREIAKAFSKRHYNCFIDFHTRNFLYYLHIKLRKYLKKHGGEPETCFVSKNTGWNKDYTMFYHYDLNDNLHELSKENVLYKYNKAESFKQTEQHELVYKLLQEGKLLGMLLVISSSSILLKPFKLQPLTCIITGSYNVDRTGAALIATSLFYKSNDIIMEGKISSLQFDIMLSSLNSLPVVIDRNAIQNNSMDIKRIIHAVASGMGKLRATNKQTIDVKELRSNVFLIADVSDLKEIKTSGAAIRRMLHVNVDRWEQFTSLFDIDTFRPEELYSGCGVDYIKFTLTNLKTLKDRFEIETKDFGYKYKEFTPLALNIYAGIFLLEEFYKHYYKQQVSFEALREKFDTLLKEARITFLLVLNKFAEVLQQYLSNNYNRFGQVETVGNGYHDYKYNILYKPNVKNMLGEYNKTTGTYYITSKGFKIIAKELGIDEKVLHNALYKEGVISKDAESKYLKILGETARVYIVKFNTNNQMLIKLVSNDG